MPEEAYCSALDVNCQDGEPRFPWQRDAAIQCDLGKLGALPAEHTSTTANYNKSDGVYKKLSASAKSSVVPSSYLLQPEKEPQKKSHSTFSSLRFWKSSSPLNSEEKKSNTAAAHAVKPTSTKQDKENHHHPKTGLLHRAVSFDSRGYSRLVQQNSEASLCSSPTLAAPSNSHLYVPQHVQTLTASPETTTSSSTIRINNDNSEFGTLICLNDDSPTSAISAPQSRVASPPATPRSLGKLLIWMTHAVNCRNT